MAFFSASTSPAYASAAVSANTPLPLFGSYGSIADPAPTTLDALDAMEASEAGAAGHGRLVSRRAAGRAVDYKKLFDEERYEAEDDEDDDEETERSGPMGKRAKETMGKGLRGGEEQTNEKEGGIPTSGDGAAESSTSSTGLIFGLGAVDAAVICLVCIVVGGLLTIFIKWIETPSPSASTLPVPRQRARQPNLLAKFKLAIAARARQPKPKGQVSNSSPTTAEIKNR